MLCLAYEKNIEERKEIQKKKLFSSLVSEKLKEKYNRK